MYYSENQNRQAIIKLGLRKRNDFYFCPLHKRGGEKTPSMKIDLAKGVFHCFGCKEGGSITHLVQLCKHDESLNLSKFLDGDYIRGSADIFGDNFKVYEPEKKVINPVDIRGVLVPLKDSPEALRYITTRYINYRVAQSAGAGYASEIYINGTPFIERATFPIYDHNKRIINVEGRDITFKHKLKCLYPKKANKPLYEYYKLDTNKTLYLVEGLIKMLVLRGDSTFANSSTTFGSRVSPYQLDLLKPFEDIVVIPDNDPAGREYADFIKKEFPGKVRVLKIDSTTIKDVDEIPKKSGMSICEWREQGFFKYEESVDF